MWWRTCALIFLTSVFSIARTAPAQIVKFESSSANLDATVTFEIQGDELHVHLENSSKNDSLVPRDLLTGVYFDVPGHPNLTPSSAFISPGSALRNGSAPGGNVGGEWAFAADLTGALNGAHYGISTAGLGMFGVKNRFPGPDLDGQANVGGMSFALVSLGDNPATGNSPLFRNPLIANAVDFVLKGMPQTFRLDGINNLSVQYGTNTSEPRFPLLPPAQAPEPTVIALLTLPFALLARRHRKS